MKYNIQQLQSDVMARLGEIARPQSAFPVSDVPWPEEIIGLKARSLLGETASTLIRKAAAESLGYGHSCRHGEAVMRKMPCGLYAAELLLPEDFLRLTSVKMAGWTRGVHSIILPEASDWNRQWSAEAGIAGCPERPRAYLDHTGGGMTLRLVGSESEADTPEWFCGWCVPVISEEGEFDFPEGLYPELTASIAGRISEWGSR